MSVPQEMLDSEGASPARLWLAPTTWGFAACLLLYVVLLAWMSDAHRVAVYSDIVTKYLPAADAYRSGDRTGGGQIVDNISTLGPGHPSLITLAHYATGLTLFDAAKLLTALAAVVTLCAAFLLWRFAFGGWVALGATLLYIAGASGSGSNLWSGVSGLPDPVLAALMLVTLLLACRPRAGGKHCFALGILCGFAFTFKPTGVLIFGALLVGELVMSPSASSFRDRWRRMLLMTAGFVLVAGAFVAHTWSVMGTPMAVYSMYTARGASELLRRPETEAFSADGWQRGQDVEPFVRNILEVVASIVTSLPARVWEVVTLVFDNAMNTSVWPSWIGVLLVVLSVCGLLSLAMSSARLHRYLLLTFGLILVCHAPLWFQPRYYLWLQPLVTALPFIGLQGLGRLFAAPVSRIIPPRLQGSIAALPPWFAVTCAVFVFVYIATTTRASFERTHDMAKDIDDIARTAIEPLEALRSIGMQGFVDRAAIGVYHGGVAAWWLAFYTGSPAHEIFGQGEWGIDDALPRLSHLVYSEELAAIYGRRQQDPHLAQLTGPPELEPVFRSRASNDSGPGAVLYRVLAGNEIRSLGSVWTAPSSQPGLDQRLIDGELHAAWSSSVGPALQTMVFDLNIPQAVNRVWFSPAGPHQRFPWDWSVASSDDGSSWREHSATIHPPARVDGVMPVLRFEPVRARFFRLTARVPEFPLDPARADLPTPIARWLDGHEKLSAALPTRGEEVGAAFDGSAASVRAMEADASLRPSRFTVSAWFKVDALDGRLHTLVKHGGESQSVGIWLAFENRSGKNHLRISSGTTLSVPLGVRAGEWVQVIVTYDGETLKAYRGRNLIRELRHTKGFSYGTTGIVLGAAYASGVYELTGRLARVTLFDRALQADEVARWAVRDALPESAGGPMPEPDWGGTPSFGLSEVRLSLAAERHRGLSTFTAENVRHDAQQNSLRVLLRNTGSKDSSVQLSFSTPLYGEMIRVGRTHELGLIDSPVIPAGAATEVAFPLPADFSGEVAVLVDPYRATLRRVENRYLRPDVFPRRGDGRSIWIKVGE